MQPQTPEALPSVTVLPEATRESQFELWGLPRECVGGSSNYDQVVIDDWLVGGWSFFDSVHHASDFGMTTHSGVLHPDEYVDEEVLEKMVEERLGFTLDSVRSVYRQGRKSADQVELRARIDGRLLEFVEDGGSRNALARVLGLVVSQGGHCQAFESALARASAAREAVAA